MLQGHGADGLRGHDVDEGQSRVAVRQDAAWRPANTCQLVKVPVVLLDVAQIAGSE
jgi:hypothetical protein